MRKSFRRIRENPKIYWETTVDLLVILGKAIFFTYLPVAFFYCAGKISGMKISADTLLVMSGTAVWCFIEAIIFYVFLVDKHDRENFREWEYGSRMYHHNIKLNALAKSKLHDVRNNYNRMSYLLNNDKPEIAIKFANASAFYYSILLNNWDRFQWTLQDEKRLLQAYYEMEESFGNEVEIRYSFQGIDPKTTRCMSDILPTLLQNSIEHAFKEMEEMPVFSIMVRREDHLLQFEISDNGKPSIPEEYIREEKPDKGLNLLKKRLEHDWITKEKGEFHRGYSYDIEDNTWRNLTINMGEHCGTIIKFIYPYETTA